MTAEPKGLAAVEMTDRQQNVLRDLLDLYIRGVPDEIAEREAAGYAGRRLADVHFA